MKIIIINGQAEVGKDKFVTFFKEESEFRIKNLSSIKRVKEISEISFGWDGKKDEKSRRFLSEIKKAWSKFNNGPFNYIVNKITADTKHSLLNKKDINQNIYFVHIREPEEIKKMKEHYGSNCITLLIEQYKDYVPDNASDKSVKNFNYDYVIENNKSVEDLREKAKFFVQKILKKDE